MRASDVVAIVASVTVAALTGALAAALVAVARTLRDLRDAAALLQDELVPLAGELRAAVRDAAAEVDHVERLVTSAEQVTGAVDSASRLAYRTLASPVVKAMAFGTGVSRGAQRLRGADGGGDGSASDAAARAPRRPRKRARR